MRDWVKLRSPKTLAEPLGVVPDGSVGQVLTVRPTGALVRFRSKYPSTRVDLDRASLIDLLPASAQHVARVFVGWVAAALPVAVVAAIGLLVDRLIIHFFGK